MYQCVSCRVKLQSITLKSFMQSVVLPAQGFLFSDFSLQSGDHHQVALQSSLGKTASSLGKS